MAEPPHQRLLDLASGCWLPDTRRPPSPTRASAAGWWARMASGAGLLVWRKDIHTPKALLLYGYGAYGTPCAPTTSRRC